MYFSLVTLMSTIRTDQPKKVDCISNDFTRFVIFPTCLLNYDDGPAPLDLFTVFGLLWHSLHWEILIMPLLSFY